jgi:hypothetical protein
MMTRVEMVFAVAELDKISFECDCGTVITFRVSAPTSLGAPSFCPACRKEFVDMARSFAAYREFYNAAVKSGYKFTFVAAQSAAQ